MAKLREVEVETNPNGELILNDMVIKYENHNNMEQLSFSGELDRLKCSLIHHFFNKEYEAFVDGKKTEIIYTSNEESSNSDDKVNSFKLRGKDLYYSMYRLKMLEHI